MDVDLPQPAARRDVSRRHKVVTISVVGLVSLALFAVGTWWADTAPHEAAGLSRSVALADKAMEGGLSGWVAEAGAKDPRTSSLAPLATTTLTLALLTNPTLDDAAWARAWACLLLALVWWGVWWVMAGPWAPLGEPTPWVILLVLVGTPPFRDATAGAGVDALTMAIVTAAIVRLDPMRRRPASVWSLGVLWGLAILVHPAGLALGVPIFAVAAVVYRGESSASVRSGDTPLPAVPLSLLLSPLVALVTVFALWPKVWRAPARGLSALGQHLDSLWRSVEGPVAAAGHLYDQASAVGPSPGAAAWEALVALSWPILLAAAVGFWLPGRSRGHATAALLLATLLLAGSLDGGAQLAALIAPLGALLAARCLFASREAISGSP